MLNPQKTPLIYHNTHSLWD